MGFWWNSWNGTGNNSFTYRQDSWAPSDPDIGCICLYDPGTFSTGAIIGDIAAAPVGYNFSNFVGIKENSRYELSLYASCHRCQVSIGVIWFNAANAYISESWVGPFQPSAANGVNADGFPRIGGFLTAPAGAVFGRYTIRVSGYNGGDNPYLFAHRAYFGKAGTNQTQLSKWVEGGTFSTDGAAIRTSSVGADKISVVNLQALSATIGHLRTTDSGARLEVHQNFIKIFDTSGNRRVQLGNLTA
jgi:hypothetical protein